MIGVGRLPRPVLGGGQLGGVPGKDIGEHRHPLVQVAPRRALRCLALPLLLQVTEPSQLRRRPAQRQRVSKLGLGVITIITLSPLPRLIAT